MIETIAERRWKLEADRRQKVREVMAEYDYLHRARLSLLRRECEQEGHNMVFSHCGPLGAPWFHCTKCGTTTTKED